MASSTTDLLPPLRWIALLAALWAWPSFSFAAEWTSGGELGLEGRSFLNDGDRRTTDQGLALAGRFELRHDHEAWAEKTKIVGRLDRYDRARDTFFPEELWLQFTANLPRLRLGIDTVTWTALEAFHPADTVNSRNFDSDLENFEKIGEPMLAAKFDVAEGSTVSALFMPVYVKTLIPSPYSRLNLSGPHSEAEAFEDQADRNSTSDRKCANEGARRSSENFSQCNLEHGRHPFCNKCAKPARPPRRVPTEIDPSVSSWIMGTAADMRADGRHFAGYRESARRHHAVLPYPID